MALRMVALGRARDGRWLARKGVPVDVREEYARLYGVSREAQLKLPADTPRHEAKVRLGEWEAEVETRIATLRAQRNGEGQPLTKLNAIALAGRWYQWFIAQYENDPGPAKRWPLRSQAIANGVWVAFATALVAVTHSSQVAFGPGIGTFAWSNSVLLTNGPVIVSCDCNP